MKTLKILSAFILGILLFTSCTSEVVVNEFHEEPVVTLDEVLHSYEIWYVDIERTQGNGEIPFFQQAFTVSFRNDTFFANNNLVGIGDNGNGFGLDVGFFDAFGTELTIDHDIDGVYNLIITQLADNEIRVHDPVLNTSYYLIGYQRNTFDYDRVFYDNIHYFLQEYTTWEKVYTSEFGVINEFDEETYIAFLPFGAGDNFKSSKDPNGMRIPSIFYDYEGHYEIQDVFNNLNRKILTLDYSYLGNEHFELSVINDRKIELLHPSSGTVYHFEGREYVQIKKSTHGKTTQNTKKRIKKADFMKLSR
ncbi:nicotinic acid mononucleotide adenyltransferase [Aquimarina hainanensis]|uniref:Nicotinic acid mononucleotide adenyltransferase n=1 Tax=Aquimarina hainanensis TaxID=1578017 RepID=A0ABW5N892_9FLAO|nr:nicotinic acid mononucleotide adenyltransferase [Aquimarina sp. TRL1]QKX04757.1 nicotinic acid mononucleotide adenyltransferase [Aquimarina sp. TRL1]